MYAFVHAKSRVGINMYTCGYLSPSASSKQLVCVCMYMYVKTPERLRQHMAVILLLIRKYFVLKVVSYFHTTTPCNLINKQSANNPTNRKLPIGHSYLLIVSPAPKGDVCYKCYKNVVF